MARIEPLKIEGVDPELIELVADATLYIGLGRFNEIVGLDPA